MVKKPHKQKPTIKQIRAVERMVENGGNVSKSMREAGYSPATAKNPDKLTESQGYKEICASYGLTPGLVLEALVDDIKGKKLRRKPELELASKLLGMMVDKHEITATKSLTELMREYAAPKANN